MARANRAFATSSEIVIDFLPPGWFSIFGADVDAQGAVACPQPGAFDNHGGVRHRRYCRFGDSASPGTICS